MVLFFNKHMHGFQLMDVGVSGHSGLIALSSVVGEPGQLRGNVMIGQKVEDGVRAPITSLKTATTTHAKVRDSPGGFFFISTIKQ